MRLSAHRTEFRYGVCTGTVRKGYTQERRRVNVNRRQKREYKRFALSMTKLIKDKD